jgi:hypothetical protein
MSEGQEQHERAQHTEAVGSFVEHVVRSSSMLGQPGTSGENELTLKIEYADNLIGMLGSKGYFLKKTEDCVEAEKPDRNPKNLWKINVEVHKDPSLPQVAPDGETQKMELGGTSWSCRSDNPGAIDKLLNEAIDQAYRSQGRRVSEQIAILKNLCFQLPNPIMEPNAKMSRASIHSSAVKAYDDTRAMFETDDDEDAANDEAPTDAEASDGQ